MVSKNILKIINSQRKNIRKICNFVEYMVSADDPVPLILDPEFVRDLHLRINSSWPNQDISDHST